MMDPAESPEPIWPTEDDMVNGGPTMVTTTPHPTKTDYVRGTWYEIYQDAAEPRPIDALPEEERRRLATAYEEVGLSKLSREVAPRQGPISPGHRLSEAELEIWTWRYPTLYRRADFSNNGASPSFWWIARQTARNWADLTWPVPEPVLALIQQVLPQFHVLEIWTPELRRSRPTGLSPILVGRRYNGMTQGYDCWLLARWAEELETFPALVAKRRSWRGWLSNQVRLAMTRESWMAGTVVLALMGVFVGSMGFDWGGVPMQPRWASGIFRGIGLGVTSLGLGLFAGELVPRLAITRRWACRYVGWVDQTE